MSLTRKSFPAASRFVLAFYMPFPSACNYFLKDCTVADALNSGQALSFRRRLYDESLSHSGEIKKRNAQSMVSNDTPDKVS